MANISDSNAATWSGVITARCAWYRRVIASSLFDGTLSARAFLGGTGVGIEAVPDAGFAVLAAYPNPARRAAQFTVTMGETAHVRVVFDMLLAKMRAGASRTG